jgi:hypothetical protein
MARITLILILAWTLLLLPALCTGGWLLHPCDCGSTIGCEHEADCSSDPCEIGMARPDSSSQSHGESDAQMASTPAVLDELSNSPDPGYRGRRPNTSPLTPQKALPFPPTDLPLLI